MPSYVLAKLLSITWHWQFAKWSHCCHI